MKKTTVKKSCLGCCGVIAILIVALMVLSILSRPGKAPPHEFDSYRLDGDACISAFDGENPYRFSHIWVLSSPDLTAWWKPNGMRAEAKLILDSEDPQIIKNLLDTTYSHFASSHNHVRTLPKGRIYHVLLFSDGYKTYAHLRFSYRSEQSDGSTTFSVVTDHNGASPVKDCPQFVEFEKRWLNQK